MPVAGGVQESMTRASWIRKMFERGTELKKLHGAENVFDLTLGNPVLEPPAAFFDTLAQLSERRAEGLHRYMPNAGFPDVRAAIAERLVGQGLFDGLDSSGVIMSVGAGGALNATLKAILNPGDEVVFLAPYFVEYNFYVRNHGGVPVVAETDDQFDIDVDALASVMTDKTRAIIVNSPNNPSGRLYSRRNLESLAAFLADQEKKIGHPIYLISDEPYRELVYTDDVPPSAASLHPHSFFIYSWSKSLSIAGERIGFVAINPATDDAAGLAGAITFTTRTLGFVNAPATMQLAVHGLLDATIDIAFYRARRDRLLEALRKAGYDVLTPEGTFYIFPRSPEPDDIAFVQRAIEKRVLLVPGSGFGRKGHFRISYSVDDRTIDGAIEGLAQLAG